MNSDYIGKGDKIISFEAERYIKEKNVDISGIQKHFIALADVTRKTLETTNPQSSLHPDLFEEPDNIPENTILRPIGLAKQLEIKVLSDIQLNGLVSTIFINIDSFTPIEEESLFFDAQNSFLPIIIFEVSRLLEDFPIFNSFYQDGDIREYLNINVGVAMDIDDGLKVYNIQDCNNIDLCEIKERISEGVYNYLRKELSIEDITGSTFTITDLSSYGACNFIPLVNSKQCAILGISSVDKLLNRFTLSLSFDHRVTTGKQASDFLNKLSENISNYAGEGNNVYKGE